ncbi:MAG: CoB--CoM heterodisulfide reductase iron-sulfur subunit A family protein [Deltaproteobacteria bacterium]|nr:CoB--CoM heterodisulfide reductase iron-sulfur subunit A family protein [Deltaproteobacteria bacterium]
MAEKIGSVLVIGGGIGGLQSALDLAEADFKVYVMDKNPSIGGVMAQLDKTFPTNDCAMCTMAPRLVEVARHHNVELLTNTDLVSVGGEAGNFRVKVNRRTRYVDETKCTGCGVCSQHCPMEALDEYNEGLDRRGAIYLSFPQAIPRVMTLDRNFCLGCGLCKNVCGTGAISYGMRDETREMNVGAIIAAPGFELFDPEIQAQYGYGRYPNVMTSLEFERCLSASGPFGGVLQRPSDGKVPEKIAFIQCVGSREVERNWCSSVCCMYATKHTLIAMEHTEGLKCTIFFIDLRAFGKGFDAYYTRAKESGVRYLRCKPSSIREIPGSRSLKIKYQNGEPSPVEEEFDLAVLSCGLSPSAASKGLAEKLGLRLNEFDFCKTGAFSPLETGRKGIFVCGPFTEPKDIPETVMQASGAAVKAMALLSSERGKLVTEKVFPAETDVSGQAPRIGVFVCHCGTNIGGVVDVPSVAEYAKTLPDVVYSEDNLYTCSTDSQERIKKAIKEHNLNRVIVASCTPRTHEPLFQNTVREGGLNEYLFEMANIRDQCSWVHMHDHDGATLKSKDLVRMAVAKARLLEPLQKGKMPISHEALVIGGGVAGMTAALDLASQGFTTHLIEKEKNLGGNLRDVKYLLDGDDPAAELKRLEEKVRGNGKIDLRLGAKIKRVDGSLGKFTTVIEQDGVEKEIHHGIVVVAIGGREFRPSDYLYGQDKRIVTQRELEEIAVNSPATVKNAKSVVMIQCVGSRDSERPYCSRICCSTAIKNALKIKEINPETAVFVLYRDIRSYGFKEAYYREARDKGVIFLRYEDDRKPEVVKGAGDGLSVKVFDPLLGKDLEISADLVALSTGILPAADTKEIGQLFKISLNQEGFFLEAHLKLRPVDFATEGVFLCGLAHSPKTVDESIIQASGAASRASTVLAKKEIPLEAAISNPVDENCDGCAYCIDPCPFKAIALIEYMRDSGVKKTVEVDPSLCKGCGVCQATCPKKGIFVKHFKLEQLSAMVDAALEAI